MRAVALALCGLCALPVPAAEGEAEFKLTLGRYASSDGNTGLDANLRATHGAHVGWIGLYHEDLGYRQARTGYEYHQDGEWLRPVFSLQAASGGVWVGSVSSEVGGASYALVGWGRTNVRNYVNLNYDPNDAITLGVGSRALPATELLLFQVRDDRLHTGQQVTHLVARWHLGDAQRISLDLSTKHGLTGEGAYVHDRSWSLGYDHGALFVRYAHDPHAGFTSANQNRLSLGTRF